MVSKMWVHANQFIAASMQEKIAYQDGTTATIQGMFSLTSCLFLFYF
jgi:hypothetical protein